MVATQNSRTMANQRFVLSEQKERKMALQQVFDAVDKLGDRFENQVFFLPFSCLLSLFRLPPPNSINCHSDLRRL